MSTQYIHDITSKIIHYFYGNQFLNLTPAIIKLTITYEYNYSRTLTAAVDSLWYIKFMTMIKHINGSLNIPKNKYIIVNILRIPIAVSQKDRFFLWFIFHELPKEIKFIKVKI